MQGVEGRPQGTRARFQKNLPQEKKKPGYGVHKERGAQKVEKRLPRKKTQGIAWGGMTIEDE